MALPCKPASWRNHGYWRQGPLPDHRTPRVALDSCKDGQAREPRQQGCACSDTCMVRACGQEAAAANKVAPKMATSPTRFVECTIGAAEEAVSIAEVYNGHRRAAWLSQPNPEANNSLMDSRSRREPERLSPGSFGPRHWSWAARCHWPTSSSAAGLGVRCEPETCSLWRLKTCPAGFYARWRSLLIGFPGCTPTGGASAQAEMAAVWAEPSSEAESFTKSSESSATGRWHVGTGGPVSSESHYCADFSAQQTAMAQGPLVLSLYKALDGPWTSQCPQTAMARGTSCCSQCRRTKQLRSRLNPSP